MGVVRVGGTSPGDRWFADVAHLSFAQGGQDKPAEVASTAASTAPVSAERRWLVAGYLVLIAGALAGITLALVVVDPPAFVPAAGFSAFAALYIVAQSLERLLEPLTKFVTGSEGPGGPQKTKAEAVKARDIAIGTALVATERTSKEAATANAAKFHQTVEQVRENTAVFIWGLASGLGMLFAGWFGLFLMRLAGATGTPIAVDVVITGLAIGGGSKPLHDLIESIQATKTQKEDPPEVSGQRS